jgi:adenosylcobyric acid synthase
MIQGTGSGVGKSLIVAGLCRIFRDRGVNVAPFKGQNMALNSFITNEGGEIGRAQAYQAEAARVEPSVDMNPILLKATGEAGCQVILNGRVHSNMQAHEYYAFKQEAWAAVTRAYERLSKRHELIIIEGAGSPAGAPRGGHRQGRCVRLSLRDHRAPGRRCRLHQGVHHQQVQGRPQYPETRP